MISAILRQVIPHFRPFPHSIVNPSVQQENTEKNKNNIPFTMDLMSFLSDEEWETVTEPLMEGKANIYPRTAFHRGGEGEIPTNHILPQG